MTPNQDDRHDVPQVIGKEKCLIGAPNAITDVLSDEVPPVVKPPLSVPSGHDGQVDEKPSPRRSERVRRENPRYSAKEYDLSVISTKAQMS